MGQGSPHLHGFYAVNKIFNFCIKNKHISSNIQLVWCWCITASIIFNEIQFN